MSVIVTSMLFVPSTRRELMFVTSFGTCGSKVDYFKLPCGLEVDSGGILYICFYYNNRIQLFFLGLSKVLVEKLLMSL